MGEIASFIFNHGLFSVGLIILNLILVKLLIFKFSVSFSKNLIEAAGNRIYAKSIYKKCIETVRKSLGKIESSGRKTDFIQKTKRKVKMSGYTGEHAAAIYMILKYIASAAAFILLFTINFPNVLQAVLVAALIHISVEITLKRKKKRICMKFNMNIYKIYKYLHNQISSGIMPTDAVRSVYLTVEDKELRDILIQLSARYELTLDIDDAIKEFLSNFDVQEAETLCVALKQGIETGDNQNILSRQEQFMFSRYFNYIQAETDGLRLRGTMSVIMFASITVIMIAVPLFKDVVEATSKIFVN